MQPNPAPPNAQMNQMSTNSQGMGNAPYFLQGSTQSDHSSPSQAHRPDDCPGCQADFEAVLKASEASAQEEERLREQRSREEEEHWRAVQASEAEEQRRKDAEDAELRLVMEASQRDEEEAQRKRLQQQREEEEHRQLLMEESRQMALREDEARVRRAHAELLERSRREAEEVSRRRRQEEERMQAMEAAALEDSRREMEEEWRRRDEEERAMEEYARQGGKQGEAAYWQHLRQDQAYDLALEMNRTMSLSNEGASSSRIPRRPLPPTPGLAALAAGVESPSVAEHEAGLEWDHPEDDTSGDIEEVSDGEDPFGDAAEAPPSYDEVRTDRPPEAPESIPEHVRFAPPPQAVNPDHSNTLNIPSLRPEKSPVSANATPRASLRELPDVSNQGSSSHSTSPTISARLSSIRKTSSVSVAAEDNGEGSATQKLSPDVQGASLPAPLNRSDTQSTTSSVRTSGELASRRSSASTLPSADTSSSRLSLQQRTMKGTEFGYANEPFSPHLKVEDADGGKKHFPTVVQLQKTNPQGNLKESRAFFVIRAPSWKMLLRALAWYGNTRVEGGPEEVADATVPIKLRLEVEFVTPTKVDTGSSKLPDWKTAHVSVCMSLVDSSLHKSPESTLPTALKQSSRSLDASYLRRGSTRRVITLPSSQPPVLPLPMVRLAQHLHQAHVFSAACPSTSQTALHSPRDLTRAIDRHDLNYMAKLQRYRKGAEEAAVSPTSEESRQLGSRRKSGEGDEEDGGEGEDEEDEMLDSGAVEAFEGQEVNASTMSRMKARMKRKLAKRSGESNAVDQDLESWISEW